MQNNIQIGPVTIHMYGLMIALGILAAVFVASKRAKKQSLSEDMIYNILWLALIGGFLGTRIVYYLTVIPEIMKKPEILWDFSNGYVVYGGIIGGILANYIYFKIKKLDFLTYFDLIMPEISLAQGFGRIGCFFAGCCHGKATDSPIGFTYTHSEYAPVGISIYPTQIISSLGNFTIFLLLLMYAKKNKAKGTVASLYMMLYSAGRFFVEFLRGDEGRGFIGVLSTSQAIAIGMFTFGFVSYIVFTMKSDHNEAEDNDEQSDGTDETDEINDSENNNSSVTEMVDNNISETLTNAEEE